jgi:hypothetical protein
MTDTTDTSAEARALITQATAGVLSETAATLRALLARAEKAEQWNRDMVAKAASDGTLEGYRDLGRKCAQLEVRAERAEAERDRLRAEVEAARRDAREACFTHMEQLAEQADGLGGKGKRDAVVLRHAIAAIRARGDA